MTRISPIRAFCLVAFLLLPSLPLAAESNADSFQFNHDIHVAANDSVGDVTCIHCSVRVRGHVSGDITVIAGSVSAEQGSSIAGDITAIAGDTRLEDGSQVAGDVDALGGTVRRSPQAAVGGNVTNVGGGGAWIFLIFLLPVIFLGGIVALIIWLIQRSRSPAPLPAYTLRRG